MKIPDTQRVVITGLGAVSPFGEGVPAFFRGLREGRSGLRRLTRFTDPLLECQVAAEVPDFDPKAHIEEKDLKRVPRVVPMAVAAAREALLSAGIRPETLTLEQKQKLGVVIGTGGGGIEFAEKQYEEFFVHQNRHVTPYSVSSSFVGMLSSEVSIALGLHGPSHVVSTGCTSSTDAIGYAAALIRSGTEERLVTGGAESCITPGLMAGFCRMRVMSTAYNANPEKASRPFDRARDGFILGEGAWMFVLESLASALARGAAVYGEILSYASTCDAYHRVAAEPNAVESARAMSLAIERAGLRTDDIRCVQLHGTATKMNDTVETRAVKLVFNGRHKTLPATALKSMIGHPQGACGAAGVLSAVFSLNEHFIAPTINYETPDPECDLDVTPNRGVPKDVETVLCNTIAFGSKNSALVLRRWDKKND